MRLKHKLSGIRVWTGVVITAFIASVAVFMVMLHTEKKILSQYEKGTVYVAVAEIPKGTMLTESNVKKYIDKCDVDKMAISPDAVVELKNVIGAVSLFDISEGVILTGNMFAQRDSILENIAEPVIAGFKADDLFQVVGGVLRTGDYIHIYSSDEAGRVRLRWSDVFVQQVFDGSGKMVQSGNEDAAAQRINIYLDKESVEDFYSELNSGSLRVVKVCD